MKEVSNGYEGRSASAGYEGRSASARIPAFRRYNEAAPSGAARRVPEAPEGVQGARGNARPETEGQALRFPRPCRLDSSFDSLRLRRQHLASEFIPGEPFPDTLTDGQIETV